MEREIKIKCGSIKGTITDGILQFRGIPYAKPPVGRLRFCLPEPADSWEGVYDGICRHFIEPQRTSNLDRPMGVTRLHQSEDCLTLSISTPSLEGRLPVAVWLHGGANCYGGGDLEWYDGAMLAKLANVVVVNINFRLGPFGFLFCPGVNEENLSIEDQMLALGWIQENIGSFGGDSQRVTVFGQSAGANSIVHILSRPDSEGLFGQMILESPSLGRGNHRLLDAFEIGEAVLHNLRIRAEEKESLWEQLAKCSADEILSAAEQVPGELYDRYQGMIFKPVKDEWHTPKEAVEAAVREAVRRKISIVIGMTKEETHAFILERDLKSLETAAQMQLKRYDLPGQAFALQAAEMGLPVWKYRFDWSAPKSVFDACHCLELPFVFGNLDAWDAPMLKGASREELCRLRTAIQTYWCEFFRFGTPDPGEWPPYRPDKRLIKCFDNKDNPVAEEPDYASL